MKFLKQLLGLLIWGSILLVLTGILFRVKQKPIEVGEVQEQTGVTYTIDSLALSNKRPGMKRRIKYIVVHNTANEKSTAKNERDYLSNLNNTASTSWHIVVDDKEAIEAVPVTEISYHAGNGEGNRYGIGIEICESGDTKQAEENAAKIIAYLMQKYDIPINNVKTHKDFSGKECPRLLLDHFEHFKEKIEKYKKQYE